MDNNGKPRIIPANKISKNDAIGYRVDSTKKFPWLILPINMKSFIPNDTQKYIISSASATCMAEVITLPLCVLKINFQNTENITVRRTISNIWTQHGFLGFYSASGWAISSQIISTTAKYTWYKYFCDQTPNKFIAGAMSGTFGSFMTHPIDMFKMYRQMHTPILPEFKKCGPILLYRGYSKALIKSIFGSTFYYPLYDTFNGYLHNNIASALLSGIISTSIMQPLDYMKTRHMYGKPFFCGWHPCPYFKGLTLNLARIVPHFTITMVLIEQFKRYL